MLQLKPEARLPGPEATASLQLSQVNPEGARDAQARRTAMVLKIRACITGAS